MAIHNSPIVLCHRLLLCRNSHRGLLPLALVHGLRSEPDAVRPSEPEPAQASHLSAEAFSPGNLSSISFHCGNFPAFSHLPVEQLQPQPPFRVADLQQNPTPNQVGKRRPLPQSNSIAFTFVGLQPTEVIRLHLQCGPRVNLGFFTDARGLCLNWVDGTRFQSSLHPTPYRSVPRVTA